MKIRIVVNEDKTVTLWGVDGEHADQIVGTADRVSLGEVSAQDDGSYLGRLHFAWGLEIKEGVEAYKYVKYPAVDRRAGNHTVFGGF